ncbi:MAG: trypsin-like peptidase domain-containing protein [Gemmatales bacterium]|nr:trypsin-like peptidase domain-containing protein [Gemmatales bacterium]MDW7993028.1 trypsin-like peptidase domain-containing protein [Gemmatales bacterium]
MRAAVHWGHYGVRGALVMFLLTGWDWLRPFPQDLTAQNPAGLSAPAPVVTDLVSIQERFQLVAKKVCPCVVYVEARRNHAERGAEEESGSGVLVRLPGRSEIFVFTNYHVVAGARPEGVVVHLADRRVLHPQRIWGDAESDVAVLSLGDRHDLPTATLGDSDRMEVGMWVLAIGSPFGLNQTVTHGILSARNRGQVSLGQGIRIKEFLQTDAPINPGSSGGPLVNLNGEVIGINTAIASPSGSSSGVAFSIPSNLFRRFALELLEKGRIIRGALGVQVAHTFEPAEALRLGLERTDGAVVEAVMSGSPAERAGLRPGDIVLELDGTTIEHGNHFINLVSDTPPGKEVTLTVWRSGQRLQLRAIVADWDTLKQQWQLERAIGR